MKIRNWKIMDGFLTPRGILFFFLPFLAFALFFQTGRVAPQPPPIILSEPEPVVVKIKGVVRLPAHHQKGKSLASKRLKRLVGKTRKCKSKTALYRLIESELLLTSPASDSNALNPWEAENSLLDAAIAQAMPEESDYSQPRTVPAQIDAELVLGFAFPDELPYREVTGLFKQNVFEEIRLSFAQLKDPEFLTKPGKVAKRPSPARSTTKKAPERSVTVNRTPEKAVVKKFIVDKKPVAAPEEPLKTPVIREEVSETVVDAPIHSVTEAAVPAMASVASVPVLGTVQASQVHATALAALPKARIAMNTQPKTQETRTAHALAEFDTRQVNENDDQSFDTDLFGRVIVGNSLKKWLHEEKAHIELYLQPLGEWDPQGTYFISYDPVKKSFREPGKGLRGRYQLKAGIFRPQDIDNPYGEATHFTEINSNVARKHIKFVIDKENIVALSGSEADRDRVNLTLTFFEGAAPDHRKPKVIPFAKVRMIGHSEEYGKLQADAQGNLTIPGGVPSRFQDIFEVQGRGTYRTFQTVSVFGADAHLPVYLIPKAKVEKLTRAIVGVELRQSLPVIMGRVFDPLTRNPLEGERLQLVDHPTENGVYFSPFADPLSPVTSSLGFLSYYNLSPGFRFLERPDSGKQPYGFFAAPGTGYYIELGRGGAKPLLGTVLDPNRGPVADAHVRLVGVDSFEAVTDDKGEFEIPDLDFPAGVVTLEVSADTRDGDTAHGYPLTLHTLSWNPRQAAQRRKIFIVQSRFVDQSLSLSQTASFGPNPLSFSRSSEVGNLIVGAYGSLLEKAKGCLYPELWAVSTRVKVGDAHGPFPFLEASRGPTCLTANHPGAVFTDLLPGRYILKWKGAPGSRIVDIGMGRDSILVN